METAKKHFVLTIEQDANGDGSVDVGCVPDSVKLASGGHDKYSHMRELMYVLAPILEGFKCPVTLCLSDGHECEYPGDPAIAPEEPLAFESWRATFVNSIHDQLDPSCAFEGMSDRIPMGSIVRTYAAGLGMWYSESVQVWQCYTTDLFEGDVARCESALYAYYVGTFLEYVNGTEERPDAVVNVQRCATCGSTMLYENVTGARYCPVCVEGKA